MVLRILRMQIHRILDSVTAAVDFAEAESAVYDDGAEYCETCEMWLNGPTQMEDHKNGKKHKNKTKSQQKVEVEHPAVHPAIVESISVSYSQATAALEDIQRDLAYLSCTAAHRHLHRHVNTRRRKKRVDAKWKTALLMKLRPTPDNDIQEVDQLCTGGCGQHIRKNRWCAGCYSANYCSKQCQKAHWREHKQVCISLCGMISEETATLDISSSLDAQPSDEEGSEHTLMTDSELALMLDSIRLDTP
jgi:hypothetical protein